MRIARRVVIVVVLLLLSSPFAWPNEDSSLDRARKVMRQYLRDTTELPLNVSNTIEVLDRHSGGPPKRSQESHRFELTAVRKNNGKTTGQAFVRKVNRKHFWQVANIDIAVLMAGFVLEPIPQPPLESDSDAGTITFAFRSRDNCSAFQPGLGGFQLAELCGHGQIVFEKSPFRPSRLKFIAAGLPVKAKRKTLRSFRFEEEFQTISISGDLLIIPKNARAEYEAERESIIVRSEYTVRRQ